MNRSQKPLHHEEGLRSHSINFPSDQDETLTLVSISELSKLLKENTHVVRNWIRDLRPHIPIYKNSVGHNLFGPEAVQILMLIKKLHREKGYSMKEIEYYLVTNGQRKISVVDANTLISSVMNGSDKEEESIDYQTLLTGEIGVALKDILKEVLELRKEVAFLRSERGMNEDADFFNEEFEEESLESVSLEPDNQTLFTRQYTSRRDRERHKRWYFQLWKRCIRWIYLLISSMFRV